MMKFKLGITPLPWRPRAGSHPARRTSPARRPRGSRAWKPSARALRSALRGSADGFLPMRVPAAEWGMLRDNPEASLVGRCKGQYGCKSL
jgi:hypothetical protein